MDARNNEVEFSLPYSMLRIVVDTSVKEIDASSGELLEMLSEHNPNVKTRRKQLELDNQIFEYNMFIMVFNHLQMQWMIEYQQKKESEKFDEWIKRLLFLAEQEKESFRIDSEFAQRESQELQLLLLALSQWASTASLNADKRISAFNEIITHIDKWDAKIDDYLIKVNRVIEAARKELKDQGMQIINQISVNQFPFITSDIYDIPKLQAALNQLHEREERGGLSPQQMVLEQRSVLENAMHPNVRAALPETERSKKLDDAADQLHQAYLPSVTKLRKAIALKERIITKREELVADRASAQIAIDHNNKIIQVGDLISKVGTKHQMDSRRLHQIKALRQEIQGSFAETEGRHDDMIARMQKHKSGEDFLSLENELDHFLSEADISYKKHKNIEINATQKPQDIEIKPDPIQHVEKDDPASEEKSDINKSDSILEQTDDEPGSSPEPDINAEPAEAEQLSINEEQPGLISETKIEMDKDTKEIADSDSDTFLSGLEEGTKYQQLPPKEEAVLGASPNPPEKEHTLIDEEQPGFISKAESLIRQHANAMADSDSDKFMSDLESGTDPQPGFTSKAESLIRQHADVMADSDSDKFMSDLESGTDSQPGLTSKAESLIRQHADDKDKFHSEIKEDTHDKNPHHDEQINPDRSQVQGTKYRQTSQFNVATTLPGTQADAHEPAIDRKDDRDEAPPSPRPGR